MTTRSEIVWLDIDDTPVVIQEKIAGQPFLYVRTILIPFLVWSMLRISSPAT